MTASKDIPVYADYAAAAADTSYPGSVFAGFEVIQGYSTESADSGSFTVPGSPYQVQLPVARAQSSITITVDAAARTIVRSSPASGQVAVDPVSGVVTFHSSDEGGTAAWSLVPLGTQVSGSLLNRIQAEVAATQTELDSVDGDVTALDARLTTAEADIDAAEADIVTNAGDIATNEGRLDAIASRNTTVLYCSPDGISAAAGANGSVEKPFNDFQDAMAVVAAGSSGDRFTIVLRPAADYSYEYDSGSSPGASPVPGTVRLSIIAEGQGGDSANLRLTDAMTLRVSRLSNVAITTISAVTTTISFDANAVVENCYFNVSAPGAALFHLSGSATTRFENCLFTTQASEGIDVPLRITGGHLHGCKLDGGTWGRLELDDQQTIMACEIEAMSVEIADTEVAIVGCSIWDKGRGSSTDNQPQLNATIYKDGGSQDLLVANNSIRSDWVWGESGSNVGKAMILGRIDFEYTLRLVNNIITGSQVGIMDSHPTVDTGRNSKDQPTEMHGNTFRMIYAAEDGPDDHRVCVNRAARGTIRTSNNLFYCDSSANTSTNTAIDDGSFRVVPTYTSGSGEWQSFGDQFYLKSRASSTNMETRAVVISETVTTGTFTGSLNGASMWGTNLDYTIAGGSSANLTINGGIRANHAVTTEGANTWTAGMKMGTLATTGNATIGGDCLVSGSVNAEDQPYVELTATQTVGSSYAAISWDAVVHETVSSMWDAGDPTRIVIPENGVYTITFQSGDYFVVQRLVLARDPDGANETVQLVVGSNSAQMSVDVYLTSGTEIELRGWRASSDSVDYRCTIRKSVADPG